MPPASPFTAPPTHYYYALRIKRDVLSSMRKQVELKERQER
jgi:hypothetical protein